MRKSPREPRSAAPKRNGRAEPAMATDKQIEANRRNAQKSTGPNTTEGKNIARANACKHGLAATTLLYSPMRHEDRTEFEEMRSDLIHSWNPVGIKELHLVEMIAGAYARMQ